jgi:hypothetical protein
MTIVLLDQYIQKINKAPEGKCVMCYRIGSYLVGEEYVCKTCLLEIAEAVKDDDMPSDFDF